MTDSAGHPGNKVRDGPECKFSQQLNRCRPYSTTKKPLTRFTKPFWNSNVPIGFNRMCSHSTRSPKEFFIPKGKKIKEVLCLPELTNRFPLSRE